MMADIYLHRILVLIPAALASDYNAWMSGTLDPDGGERTFTIGLNATGNPADPVTHYVCCIALTAAQLRAVLDVLCPQAGIAFPGNWDAMTVDDQRDWTRQQAPAIEAATGLRAAAVDDNLGTWSDYAAIIATAGLMPIQMDA